MYDFYELSKKNPYYNEDKHNKYYFISEEYVSKVMRCNRYYILTMISSCEIPEIFNVKFNSWSFEYLEERITYVVSSISQFSAAIYYICKGKCTHINYVNQWARGYYRCRRLTAEYAMIFTSESFQLYHMNF